MESAQPVTADMLWHYTLRQPYEGMLRAGQINPSNAFAPQAKRPAVWFTTSPDWDPIVNKAIRLADESLRILSRDELHTIGLGPMRVGVPAQTAQITWHDYKRESGIPAKAASQITAAAARCQSHPSAWFATFEPVPRSKWAAVEQWDGWRWAAV